jgi:hypothetical protein
MVTKNSVYTVTPPDLTLQMIGPSVLMLGITREDSKPYLDLYDKLFPDVEITVYVADDGFDPEHVAWFRAVAGMASSVFVNVDSITTEELLIATQMEHEDRAMVFWMSQEKTQPVLLSLLNSYQFQVFNSLDEIETMLTQEFEKNT